MARQLVLLDTPGADWRLDDRTREIGRRGVAEARAVLDRAGGSPAGPAPGDGGGRRGAGRPAAA